jgi:hypothetical protein
MRAAVARRGRSFTRACSGSSASPGLAGTVKDGVSSAVRTSISRAINGGGCRDANRWKLSQSAMRSMSRRLSVQLRQSHPSGPGVMSSPAMKASSQNWQLPFTRHGIIRRHRGIIRWARGTATGYSQAGGVRVVSAGLSRRPAPRGDPLELPRQTHRFATIPLQRAGVG